MAGGTPNKEGCGLTHEGAVALLINRTTSMVAANTQEEGCGPTCEGASGPTIPINVSRVHVDGKITSSAFPPSSTHGKSLDRHKPFAPSCRTPRCGHQKIAKLTPPFVASVTVTQVP